MWKYYAELYDRTGARLAFFDTWRSLHYVKLINGLWSHDFEIWGDDPRIPLFTLDTILRVMKYNPELGIEPFQDYIGLTRSPNPKITENDLDVYTSYGRGLQDLLKRRYIQYAGGSAHTDFDTASETVMKLIVEENGGSLSLTTNDRFKDGVWPNFQVQGDGGLGAVFTGSRPGRVVFDVLVEIADHAVQQGDSIDFDVVCVSLSPLLFEFRTYVPFNGTDRSTTVVFSTGFGNMRTPSYLLSRTDEITSVTVMGQGTEADRDFSVVSSAAVTDSPWNDIETITDARLEDADAGLDAVGLAALQRLGASEHFDFITMDNSRIVYGRDAFLGDRVAASFKDILRTPRIIKQETLVNGEQQGRDTLTIGEIGTNLG